MTMPQTASSRTPWHRYLYPLIALSRRDIKKRYAGSMLGVTWTILQPVTLILVYAVVFGLVLRTGRGDARTFVVSLLCGMLPYLAINDALQRCSFALKEDKTLLERETFPASVIPTSRVVTASMGEVVGLAMVAAASLFNGDAAWWLLALPVLIVLRVLLTVALGWIVSLLSVFVSDLNEVLSLILTVWLFLTPIFYAPDMVPSVLRWTLVINPLHHVATAYRLVLADGQAPWPAGAWLLIDVIIVGVLGRWFFSKAIDRGKDLL